MLHLISILFFLLVASFGLTVVSVSLSENRRRIIAALRGSRPKYRYGRVTVRPRLIRA